MRLLKSVQALGGTVIELAAGTVLHRVGLGLAGVAEVGLFRAVGAVIRLRENKSTRLLVTGPDRRNTTG